MARRAQIEPVTTPVMYGNRWRTLNRDRLPFWLLLVIILLGGALLLWALTQFFPGLYGLDALPFAIHSPLQADYSADLRGTPFASVNLNLLSDALSEESGGAQMATIFEAFKSPVPTITPQYPSTGQPSPTPMTALPSATQALLNLTGTPVATASPTLTLVNTATLRPSAPNPTAPPVVLPTASAGPPVESQPTAVPATAVPPTAVPPTEPPTPAPTAIPPDYPPPGPTTYPPPM